MRSRVAATALVLLIGALAHAQDDIALRAMKDELKRSITELQLQQMDKPYFLAYRMDDINQTTV
jgi:hypothetical protein